MWAQKQAKKKGKQKLRSRFEGYRDCIAEQATEKQLLEWFSETTLLVSQGGVTLTLLWEEYRRECYDEGKKPYMFTQFGEKYRKCARVTKATMRIQHKPGDAIEVDWAGDTIPIFDSVTGEQSKAYLFVAVLPCSNFAYAEVCSVSAR